MRGPGLFAAVVSLALGMLVIAAAPAGAAGPSEEETIKSLDKKSVELRPGRVIVDSTDLARDNYRAFLDLASEDPELRAEAMRRLADLELEASEAAQLMDEIDSLEPAGYGSAVSLYQQLLESYPDYRRNDTVLYQLARAYETGGRTDDALQVLNELVGKFPGYGAA